MSANDNRRGRREPTLGNLEQVDTPPPAQADDLPRVHADGGGRRAPPRRRSRTPPHRTPSPLRSWLWPLLAILLVALLALAWINQDRLRAMLPRTHLNTMLVKADKALSAGHLEGTDGTSAHELYARVLQEEPDNNHALNGLRQVGKAELARASSAIKAHDFDAAKQSIANARRLLGGGSEVDKATQALRQAEHPQKSVHETIHKAQKAMAAGQITGPEGAAALYHQVLRVDADNTVARHGLEQAGDALASRARDALRQGDIDTAASLVAELGKLQPQNGDLPSLRARLSQARQATGAAVKEHLQSGRKDLHAGQFSGDGDDNALAQFQAVLKLDPDNAEARAGLRQVAQALILRANAAMDGEDAAQAGTLLRQAAKLAPKSPDLAVARARLSAMQGESPAAASSLASVTAGGKEVHPALTPLQQVEIKQLVSRARTAANHGNIMLPPGESAYDLYSEALTIDANNAKARAGMNALPGLVVKHFHKALAADHLHRADGYLATLRSLQPDPAQADALGRKLADAWLDRARSAADEGNRTAALKALDAARKLSPESSRVSAMAKRLNNK